MTPRRKPPPRDLFPSDDEIVHLAHELRTGDCGQRGGPANYLRAAEDELLERAFRRVVGQWGAKGAGKAGRARD